MTTIRDSNTAFITILDPLPQENIGWWLEFYDFQTQNLLARVYTYLDFSFSVPLSDVGACEINMSDYDPLWTSILPNTQVGTYILDGGPHFVDFIDEGVRRQRCILDKHTLAKVREDGSRPRQITGKGLATVLDWGVVLPVSIGASTSGNRVFTGAHWASVWRTLFLEAQTRGAIPNWVTTSFDATLDTYGVAWGDVGNYEIPEGQSLLDLLQQFSEQHGFEWRMYSNGILAAAPALGDDRSSTVRFFEHESIVTADDSSDRQDLRTYVYVLGGDNLVTLASDTSAATTWGRREKWVNQSSATDSNARTAVATTLLGLAKNPINSRTFKVPFDPTDPDTGASTHRRAFVDYETGFVIGYGPNTDPSTNFRIVEMAVQVDPDKTELEITVMSRIQREIDRLSKLLARILTGQTGISGVGGASGSISSTVIAAAIRLGDLLNVHVDAAVAKDTIVFDGTNWNSGRSALDDLSDVDVSTATPGQVLTLSGGVWVGATPSGGGGSAINDRRWVRGSTAHALDDEFRDASIAAAWINVDGNSSGANVTWAEGGDSLTARMIGGDGNGSPNQYLHCKLKAYALAVGESIQTYISANNPNMQYPIQGLVISDSATDGSGTQLLWATVWDLGNERYGAASGSGFRTRASWSDIGGRWMAGSHMKMVRSATLTYDLYTSSDAVSWGSKFATLTAAGGYTPSHVGLWCSGLVFGSPSVAEVGFDYFRVNA